jgi:hypothetical protein
MAVYVISYDLNAPGQDYSSLIGALVRARAVRFQRSAWLTESNQSAIEIRDALLTYMDNGDSLMVAEIALGADWAASNMEAPSGQWLKSRR